MHWKREIYHVLVNLWLELFQPDTNATYWKLCKETQKDIQKWLQCKCVCRPHNSYHCKGLRVLQVHSAYPLPCILKHAWMTHLHNIRLVCVMSKQTINRHSGVSFVVIHTDFCWMRLKVVHFCHKFYFDCSNSCFVIYQMKTSASKANYIRAKGCSFGTRTINCASMYIFFISRQSISTGIEWFCLRYWSSSGLCLFSQWFNGVKQFFFVDCHLHDYPKMDYFLYGKFIWN